MGFSNSVGYRECVLVCVCVLVILFLLCFFDVWIKTGPSLERLDPSAAFMCTQFDDIYSRRVYFFSFLFFFFCKFREKQVCPVFTCCVCLFHSERWATYWPSDWCQGFICLSQQSPSSSATSKITFTDSVSSCNVQCRHRHRLLWMNEWINIQKRQWARSWSLTIWTNEQNHGQMTLFLPVKMTLYSQARHCC